MHTSVHIHRPEPVLRLPSFEQAARRRRARVDAAQPPAPRRRIASASHPRPIRRQAPETAGSPAGRTTVDTRFTIPLPPPIVLD